MRFGQRFGAGTLLGLCLDKGHIYHEGLKVRKGHEAFFLSFELPGNCKAIGIPTFMNGGWRPRRVCPNCSYLWSPKGQRSQQESFVTFANFEPFVMYPTFDP